MTMHEPIFPNCAIAHEMEYRSFILHNEIHQSARHDNGAENLFPFQPCSNRRTRCLFNRLLICVGRYLYIGADLTVDLDRDSDTFIDQFRRIKCGPLFDMDIRFTTFAPKLLGKMRSEGRQES